MSQEMNKPAVLGVVVRRSEICVGDAVLELREPGITATHRLIEAVVDDRVVGAVVDVAMLFSEWENEQEAAGQAAREVSKETGEDEGGLLASLQAKFSVGRFIAKNIGRVIGALKDAVLPLLTKKAGLAAAIVLDTAENRRRLGLDSAQLLEHVQEEMSLTQAVHVLTNLWSMVDWSDITGKVRTLLPKAEPARQEPEAAAEVAPVPAVRVVTQSDLALTS